MGCWGTEYNDVRHMAGRLIGALAHSPNVGG